MPASRHFQRAFLTASVAALFAAAAAAGAEQNAVQKLIERGALQEAVERASEDQNNVESTYLAAQAFVKMNNEGAAGDRYNRLRETGDDSWRAIGESGAKLLADDVDGAMDAANRAIAANEGNAYAYYQLGLAANKQGNYQKALEGFANAIERKPDLAYAHFYAGVAAQRLRQTAKMVEYFQNFLHLAPDAPERQGVQSILRTVG